jgi:hypothetical protein
MPVGRAVAGATRELGHRVLTVRATSFDVRHGAPLHFAAFTAVLSAFIMPCVREKASDLSRLSSPNVALERVELGTDVPTPPREGVA